MATNTNTSYNGSFLSYDKGTDYQAKINEAVKSGNFSAAATYEAQRNAKLSDMGKGNEATTNYVNVYNNGKTNNQGGTIYAPKNTSPGTLTSGQTGSYNGATYKNDGGTFYQKTGANSSGSTWGVVGDGWNGNNEFTMSNPNMARDMAYQQYVGSGGTASKEYALSKLIDPNYISALGSGSAGQYSSDLVAKAKAENDEKKAKAASVTSKRYGDVENSFESDNDEEVKAVDRDSAYDDYIRTIMTGGRRHVR